MKTQIKRPEREAARETMPMAPLPSHGLKASPSVDQRAVERSLFARVMEPASTNTPSRSLAAALGYGSIIAEATKARSAGESPPIQGKFLPQRAVAQRVRQDSEPAHGKGLTMKKKYLYMMMVPFLRKWKKPKPGVWNKAGQSVESRGKFTFELIEPLGEVDWSRTNPADEAERREKREAKVREVHHTLAQWEREYADYQEKGWLTEKEQTPRLKSHGEEIAHGLKGQLAYVEDESGASDERSARIDEYFTRMGVDDDNQRAFVIARYQGRIVGIGSAYGNYIDHVVASPESQLQKGVRPEGTVLGGGRAVTHKMIRLMGAKGLRPTVSPQSPKAVKGLEGHFVKRA